MSGLSKSDFFFDLPKSLIAQSPVENRSQSKLMILDKKTDSIEHKRFVDLIDYLDKGDCLVLNDTRVIPARLIGTRRKGSTEKNFEVFLLRRTENDIWECLAKPAKRLHIGDELLFEKDGKVLMSAKLIDVNEKGNRLFHFFYDGVFEQILDICGQMPLPPYIKQKLDDKNKYQTVYAKKDGSVAAPTAGLHFTTELLGKIKDKGIKVAYLTLHVGLGTFRPVQSENIPDHQMHSEFYSLSRETAELINETRRCGGRIIAVGTTSCRTLESCATDNGYVNEGAGWTDIFIYPGYKFKTVDALVTNFHLPESTLIMLVSAFYDREKVLFAYREAIKNNYRFFSFGDAMFIK